MKTMRHPGDHPWHGEEFAPDNYLIAEQDIFEVARQPGSDALFRLKHSLSIFTEHVRHQDTDLGNTTAPQEARQMLRIMFSAKY